MFGLPVQSWELDSARLEWDNILLNIPTQHRRPVKVRTASAGFTTTYEVIGTPDCYIEPDRIGSPRDEQQADGQDASTYWILSLSVTLSVQPTDRFIINYETYEVVDTNHTATSDPALEVVQTVRVQRLKGNATLIFTPSVISANPSIKTAGVL